MRPILSYNQKNLRYLTKKINEYDVIYVDGASFDDCATIAIYPLLQTDSIIGIGCITPVPSRLFNLWQNNRFYVESSKFSVRPFDGKHYHLFGDYLNLQQSKPHLVEKYGLMRVIEMVKANYGNYKRPILICCDCKWAIRQPDLIPNDFPMHIHLEIMWVPAHKNIFGNELADFGAKSIKLLHIRSS
jgi:hypothetical protein